MHFSNTVPWYPLFLRYRYTSHGAGNADLKVMMFFSPSCGYPYQISILYCNFGNQCGVCGGRTPEPGLQQHGDTDLCIYFAAIFNILIFSTFSIIFCLLFYLSQMLLHFFLVLFLLKCSTFVLFFL